MSKKYFGTDGIRGRVNQNNINGEMFFKFGLVAGKYFKNQKKSKQTAIIAKDTRLSGYTLEPAWYLDWHQQECMSTRLGLYQQMD